MDRMSISTRGVGSLWGDKALKGQAIVCEQWFAPPMLCLLRTFRRLWSALLYISKLPPSNWVKIVQLDLMQLSGEYCISRESFKDSNPLPWGYRGSTDVRTCRWRTGRWTRPDCVWARMMVGERRSGPAVIVVPPWSFRSCSESWAHSGFEWVRQ